VWKSETISVSDKLERVEVGSQVHWSIVLVQLATQISKSV